MNDTSRILQAINYIESNLKEPIGIGDVANHVGISFWHFQRLFSIMINQSIGTYIRNRRVQSSIDDLRRGKLRVVDIAFEYQFESHEVYTRAFKSLFGVPPSRHRSLHNRIKYPRLTLSPSLKNLKTGGNMKLEPEIENWESKKFVGLEIGPDELLNEEMPIAKLWGQFFSASAAIPHSLPDAYGLYTRADGTGFHDRYIAAAPVSEYGEIPEEFSTFELESGLFAIFEFNGGVEALPETTHYIYREWLPQSEYRTRRGYDMEIYQSDYDAQGVLRIAVPIQAVE